MRWSVEVTSLHAERQPRAESVHIDADTWQKALEIARSGRGDQGPLSNFSIELIEDGCRAVDSSTLVRYSVRLAPEGAASGTAPAAGSSAAIAPTAGAAGAIAHAEGPAGAIAHAEGPAGAIAHAEGAPGATAAALAAPHPASSSLGGASTHDGAPRPSTPSGSPGSSFGRAPSLPPRPNASHPPPASRTSPSAPPPAMTPAPPLASPASTLPQHAPAATAPVAVAPGVAVPAAPIAATSAAAAPMAAVPAPAGPAVLAAPASQRADVEANLPSQIIFKREQDRNAALPVTYREYVYLVPPGTSEAAASTLLRAQLDLVRTSLERFPPGKLVNLAVFDVSFQGKPPTAPLATLTWKDWRTEGAGPAKRPAEATEDPSSTGGVFPAPASFPPPSFAASPAHATQGPPSVSAAAVAHAPVAAPPAVGVAPGAPPAVGVAPGAPPAIGAAPGAPVVAAPVAVPVASVPVGIPSNAIAAEPSRRLEATTTSAAAPDLAPVAPAAPIASKSAPDVPVANATPAEAPASVAPAVAPPAAAPAAAAPALSSPAAAPAAAPPSTESPATDAPAAVPPPAPTAAGSPGTSDVATTATAAPEPTFTLAAVHPPTPGRAMRPPGMRVSGDELIADLFESMHDLHFCRDAVEGADFCLTLAMGKLPCQAGLVHLYDIDRREFVVTSARGTSAALLLRRYPESDVMLSKAMRRRRVIVIADAAGSSAESFDRYVATGRAKSLVVAPAMQAGRFLGAIELLNPLDGKPFTESDGAGVMYIAEQLAAFVAARGVVTDPERISAGR